MPGWWFPTLIQAMHDNLRPGDVVAIMNLRGLQNYNWLETTVLPQIRPTGASFLLLGDNPAFSEGGARCAVTQWLCHVADAYETNDRDAVAFANANPDVYAFVQTGLWSRGAPGEHMWGQVPGTTMRAYSDDTHHLWEDVAQAYLTPYFCSAFKAWGFYPGLNRTLNASYVLYNSRFEDSVPV